MTKEELNYLGLIFDCPVGGELSDCGFRSLRKCVAKERLNYYEALSITERESLIEQHQRCLSKREKKTLFHESQ